MTKDLLEFTARGAKAQAEVNEIIFKLTKRQRASQPLALTITEPELMELLGQVVGAASLCWSVKPKGEFDTRTAAYIVDSAYHAITKRIK